jgi:hypothetical protein
MAVSQSQIDQINALVRARYPLYNFVHPETIIVNATIPANTPAGVQTNSAILVNGSTFSSFPIPQSQVWVITDMYITSTAADPADAQITFTKNGIKPLLVSAPLSANVVTNNSRPGIPAPLLYEPNSSLQLPAAPIVTAGTTTATDTFLISVTIYDASYAAQ